MDTKVSNFLKGDTTNAEAIYTNGQKYLRFNGETKPLEEFPLQIQVAIFNIFLADKESHMLLRKMGIKKSVEQFEQWYKCVVGGVNTTPDFTNWAQLTADAFNNTCTDNTCTFRGKLCGRAMGLNSIEIQTIRAFSEGNTIKQVAKLQFVTEAAIKSRLNVIHYKTKTVNMANLMMGSTKNGII